MSTISAFDAKTRFGELLERVARGEEIVITRHDKPVARIVPEGPQRSSQIQRGVAGLREVRVRIHARTRGRRALSDAEVRSAIAQGRR